MRGSGIVDRGSGVADRGSRIFTRLVRALALAAAIASEPAASHAQEPGSELTVYLLTMGVGDLLYERFGHNAIWIHNPQRGTELAYNWGVFSFDQPGFMQNFLKGRMLYQMQPQPMDRVMFEYQYFKRTMWAQELNLTPAQKAALQEFVDWNAKEENKFYRYDYYRDNCSTRVRDALDRVLGGTLRRTLEARATNTTYRSETRRLMFTDIPILTGMNLGMGPAVDQPLSAWEQSFIPMRLRDWVREMKVAGANGEQLPLVKSEQTLYQSPRAEPPEVAPNLTLWYLLAGLLIAGVLVLFGSLPQRWSRITFGVVVGVWSLIIGLLGTLITGLWAFTDHWVTYRNENVLQASMLWLVLLVGLIGWAFGKGWGFTLARRMSLVVAALAGLGLIIQVLPGFDQVNADIIALLLPANVAVAWVLTRRGRQSARVEK